MERTHSQSRNQTHVCLMQRWMGGQLFGSVALLAKWECVHLMSSRPGFESHFGSGSVSQSSQTTDIQTGALPAVWCYRSSHTTDIQTGALPAVWCYRSSQTTDIQTGALPAVWCYRSSHTTDIQTGALPAIWCYRSSHTTDIQTGALPAVWCYRSSHTTDIQTGALPAVWCYRVSAGVVGLVSVYCDWVRLQLVYQFDSMCNCLSRSGSGWPGVSIL